MMVSVLFLRRLKPAGPFSAAVGEADKSTSTTPVVQAGTRTYNCRSCTAEFGSTQVICTNCYAHEDPAHLSTHQWMTTDFLLTSGGVDTLTKGSKISFNCPLCPGQGEQGPFALEGNAKIYGEMDR